jgi:hypothetical protein
MTDDTKSADIIPHEVFRQRQLNRWALRKEEVRPVPLLDPGFDSMADREVPVMDRSGRWPPEYVSPGPLTRWAREQQSDPGDEV